MDKDLAGERKRILDLLYRREMNILTDEERTELEGLFEKFPDMKAFSLKSAAERNSVLAFMDNVDDDAAWNKMEWIHGPIGKSKISLVKRFSLAAAMVTVITTACVYLFVRPGAEKKETAVITQPTDIYPPEGKASLTLADGKIITLEDNQHKGVLASQGGSAITNANNELVYAGGKSDGELLYNTVSTAEGASYKLVLADGTRVWLNTNSSIRFPVAFTGNDRQVSVTGEAYFEVAKNKSKPFAVTVNDMRIDVLGTNFNVNAYTNERSINTTLINGSVMVKSATKQQLLKPGEQSRIRSGTTDIEVTNKIDLEEVMGWQRNQFVFRGTSLQHIMRRLQQYYGMEVEYKGKVQDDATFVATFPRNEPVSRVLNLLEKTGMVHFEIADKKIIVKP